MFPARWRSAPQPLAPVMGWTFETREARADFFATNVLIYWYIFPEEHDEWRKGLAWKIAAAEEALAKQEPSDVEAEDRW